MAATIVAGVGVLISPRPDTPQDALAQAETLLEGRGLTSWDVYELQLGRRLTRAWWVEGAGFVSDDWDGAVAVAVISLPAQWTEDTPPDE